ncbi:23S rRNA pseudouridine(2605) synthase RluB [Gilliamella sp. Pra-s65]|uniref:23S rRNA pseudouridine(2605) synthase RluB n=1 Tax=unclassified Gilliamella TaxID=2685620 RepID=UPI00132512CD|nr:MULTISPECIES: 23S rRNA pseudouridine(2605) synthase RluB [unclassified Gilliamella]MWN32462.1 23S rRNA pseudouridine(2605) synthase RluB [Gilliamella sp. Pra-s60]MWN89959.1 23S rRNA pseudouridine(2605) synthase RluB [Gilliamella sp. Pra-s65]MWP29849.1 23S rRNA pseudouridine(2605) synthase RluB [Gilliamella sp. Pra-s54]MWP72914.1 23S rRNA pseudouridine(2605) synthase RluB [Gilliamella sp. Pra-s52]
MKNSRSVLPQLVKKTNNVKFKAKESKPNEKPKTPIASTATRKTSTRDNTEKLQKVLANLGNGSRREIEAMIMAGKISVDGKIATLGDRVDVNANPKIRINGHLIQLRSKEKEICRVLAYYKPEGEICSRNDPQGRATVFERLPRLKNARWINIGRLDINTSGLLLFTTDGELANRLMHPRHEIEREYAVRIFGKVTDQQIFQLRKGVQLEDGPASFKSIKAQGGDGINQWFNVVITEGRNREVRRMWEAVDVQVSRLLRIRYGDISLPKGLSRGTWLELDIESVNYLRQIVGMPQQEKSFVKTSSDKRMQRPKRAKLTNLSKAQRSTRQATAKKTTRK